MVGTLTIIAHVIDQLGGIRTRFRIRLITGIMSRCGRRRMCVPCIVYVGQDFVFLCRDAGDGVQAGVLRLRDKGTHNNS